MTQCGIRWPLRAHVNGSGEAAVELEGQADGTSRPPTEARQDHPTSLVVDPDTGETIEIDVELAGIITAAWQLGIRTVQCCQHEQECDSAWIQFERITDASRFLAALFADSPDDRDDLFDRQRDWEVASPEPSRSRLCWRWKVAPALAESGEWGFDVMVEFPAMDLPEVERRMLQCHDHP
jgi:hypothetical protein